MRAIPVLLSLVCAAAALADPGGQFSSGRLSFSVTARGETIDYREMAISVLPEEAVELKISDKAARAAGFEASAQAGTLRSTGPGKWMWKAPATAGVYTLTIRSVAGDETMRLHGFVLVPLASVRDGALNGYAIGSYPKKALKGLEIYKPPRGFIEVTAENVDTPVAPHFTLRQFLCKQSGGYPKYVIVNTRLLLKLEKLLEQFNAVGLRADSFYVMSGFRTPQYNRAIGNVKYSRHIYGGAVDIFIDERPRDDVIDDLNHDGKIDVNDAAVLFDLIDKLYGTDSYKPYVGGLGRYKKTASHGPFVHVDVRGFRARWGD